MQYDLDVLFQNRKALATIYFPSTGTYDFAGNVVHPDPIYALLEHDFNTHVQAIYNGVDAGQTNAAQQGANMAQAAFGGVSRVITSVQQTLQRWNGHSSPIFTIPVTIVKYKQSVDILSQVRYLLSAPAGNYDNVTLKAPYGYGHDGILDTGGAILSDLVRGSSNLVGITNANNISAVYQNISSFVYGTWTLRIADYFLASDLVITDVQATISKETVQGSNEPLYAQLQVSFTTAYLPDARTIQAWFLPILTDNAADALRNGAASQGNNNNAPL